MNCCIRVKGITEVIAVTALTAIEAALHAMQATPPEIEQRTTCLEIRQASLEAGV